MSVRVATYMLNESFPFESPTTKQTITLPPGTFVKPIEDVYLPKHVKESLDYKYHDPKEVVFCYCSLGIIPIPKKIIVEA